MRLTGFRVTAEGDLAFLGVDDFGVTAEDFESWTDAGEDEVRTANAFAL